MLGTHSATPAGGRREEALAGEVELRVGMESGVGGGGRFG